MNFDVELDGTVTFDSAYDGVASGSGTTTLTLIGTDVMIDGTALSALGLLVYANGWLTLDNSTTHTLRLMPGSHFVQYSGNVGNRPQLNFDVELDGTVTFDSAYDGVASGSGTTTLTLIGTDVMIDGTALSALGLLVYANGWLTLDNSTTHTLRLMPGSHFVQYTEAGSTMVIPFTVDQAGSIDYDPSFDSLVSGRGTSTLTIGQKSPMEQVGDLSDAVNDLLSGGTLTQTDAADLQGKLDGALEKLAIGQTAKAIKKLEDFIGKVEKLAARGTLSASEASELIDGASQVIDDLST